MTRSLAARAAASTSRQGPTADCRRLTSLPSVSPKPPGSRKSRCISMMISAVRSRSTHSGVGSASMLTARMTSSLPSVPFVTKQDRDQRIVHLIARQDHVFQDWVDLSGPALAAEHAVVANPRLHVMPFAVGPQAGAEIVRRDGLADRADVVAFALDREQRGLADRLGIHAMPAKLQRAERQRVLLKYQSDRLQIELRR